MLVSCFIDLSWFVSSFPTQSFQDMLTIPSRIKDKIQNSRLNLREANSPPVAPSDVKKMPALTSLFCSTSNRQCILSRKSGPTLQQPYRASLVCFKYPFHSSPSIVKGDKSCIDHRVIKEQPHLYASEHFAGLSSHITLSL